MIDKYIFPEISWLLTESEQI
jgi:hypothetical protein